MNKVTPLLFAASVLSSAALAEGQHSHYAGFQFNDNAVAELKLSSLLQLDSDQFVFNNQLQGLDWQQELAGSAPFTLEQQQVIMNFAGHYSINPHLLLTLMEVGSGLLSDFSEEKLVAPFGDLSEASGFAAQVEDVAALLYQRFYAYREFAEQLKKPTSKGLAARFQHTAATVAVQSLLNHGHTDTSLADVVTQYQLHFAKQQQTLLRDPQKMQAEGLVAEQAVNNLASFSMSLPWPYGNYWYSGGAHSNTGSGYPYSSLDFNNGSGGWGSNTPWVQASHSGTVTRYSSCNMRITHSSGYATQYYHMDSLQYNTNAYVNGGAWIGRYANNLNQALCQGGQSSGPHVHFSLLYNGYFVTLQNQYISGYRVDVGNSNYDSNCNNFYFEKNGRKTCAWSPLYNN